MKKKGHALHVLAAGFLLFFLSAPVVLDARASEPAGSGEGVAERAADKLREILGSGSARAEQDNVKLKVKIILASNDGSGVDPKLGDLSGRLASLKFNSFKLVSTESLKMNPPKGGEVSLPGGKVLQVGEVERADSRVLMDVSVEGLVRTRVSLTNDGTVILGGINENGGELILAISAKF